MINEIIRNNLRTILVIAGILLATLVAYGIYIAIERTDKIAVVVSVVPSDAHLTINGNPASSSGTVYLKAGVYDLTASREGFKEYTTKQAVNEDQKTIVVSLAPESDDAKKWASENGELYTKNEGLGGQEAAAFGTAFREKNPITNVLPVRSLLYLLSYQADLRDPTGNTIIITIEASKGYRNAAIEKIRSLGYDPTDFNIKFIDYTNPFAS